MDGPITKLDLWLAASAVTFCLGMALIAAAERAQPGLARLAAVLGEILPLLRQLVRQLTAPDATRDAWREENNRRALGEFDVTDEFAVVEGLGMPRHTSTDTPTGLGGFIVEEGLG